MSVADLKHKDIVDLAYLLDGGNHDWCGLGIQLLPEIGKNEIQFLKHGYTEEESLTWRFIQSLSSKLPKATISNFIRIGRKLRRNDVAIYLERQRLNFAANLPIWELPWTEMKVLLNLLEREVRDDWRMFADELGYSNFEITAIVRKRSSYQSPTVLLFRMMIINKPELKIKDIIAVCANIRRSDAVGHLKRVLSRLSGQ